MTQVKKAIAIGVLSLANTAAAITNIVLDGPVWVGITVFVIGISLLGFAFFNANVKTPSTRNLVGQATGMLSSLAVTFALLGASLYFMGSWGLAVSIPASIAAAWFMEAEFDKRFPRA